MQISLASHVASGHDASMQDASRSIAANSGDSGYFPPVLMPALAYTLPPPVGEPDHSSSPVAALPPLSAFAALSFGTGAAPRFEEPESRDLSWLDEDSTVRINFDRPTTPPPASGDAAK